MAGLNQVMVEGNVTRDAETFMCKNGRPLCRVPIAVNRYYKNKTGGFDNEVSYFDVVTFGDVAERCRLECTKGRGIRVTGRLKQDRYVGKDGKNRSGVSIVADYVDFKPRRAAASGRPYPASWDAADAGGSAAPYSASWGETGESASSASAASYSGASSASYSAQPEALYGAQQAEDERPAF